MSLAAFSAAVSAAAAAVLNLLECARALPTSPLSDNTSRTISSADLPTYKTNTLLHLRNAENNKWHHPCLMG